MLKAVRFHEDAFTKWLTISVVTHLSFVLIFALKSFIFPSKTIVIQNAIRVDMIGLPEKIQEPKPAPVVKTPEKPKPEPKPEAKPKPQPKAKPKPEPKKKVVDIKSEKKDQAAAMEKLKQLSAIDKIKQDQKEPAPAQTVPDLPQYKGNQVLAGNSFSGVAGISAQDYFSEAKAHIQQFWSLPEWLQNTQLRASVVVKLNDKGVVERAEISESSGETAFDDAALSAVQAASPFPVPPESIRATILNSWVIFNFPQ